MTSAAHTATIAPQVGACADSRPDVRQVVIISEFGHVNGGSAQVAISSSVALAQAGISVRYIYAVGPVDPRLHTDGIELVRIDSASVWEVKNPVAAAVKGIWNRTTAQQMSAALADLQSGAVIHLHQWTKAFSPSVIAAALNTLIPCAITLHDYFFVCPNGSYYNFRTGQPCETKPLSWGCLTTNCDPRGPAYKLVRIARSGVQQRSLLSCPQKPTIVHVSDFAKRVAAPFLPADANHFVVPNPISISAMERTRVEENQVFLFVGRLVSEKGCVELARAAKAAGVRVRFVGSGPAEQAIRAANPEAEFTGWIAPADLPVQFRQARALVFPSRWYETGGLVCAEAMRYGVPVLASNRTAAAELIEEQVNGATFSPDDHRELVRVLQWLQDPAAAEAASRAAHRSAQNDSQMTMQAHTEHLTSVYRSMLAARG